MNETFKTIVIVGGGGLGREAYDYAIAAGLKVRGFLDDTKDEHEDPTLSDAPVLGPIDGYEKQSGEGCVIAVGEPIDRAIVSERLRKRGASFASVIHPSAVVSSSARIEAGCIVAPLCYIGPRSALGFGSLVNVQACVGHDVKLGAYSVLSPHAAVNGWSVVGEGVFVGSGAVVLPRMQVGAHARISAGAVVMADVPEGAGAFGNPAHIRL
ncbi:MAG: NeuD/PglB/VioB family sugar acetyltransferase [Alphaproteobacteria bacterium]|nr:NeuD/PglB/VioB family sugar acetyltransferase [Alphaproteobacteria bacterium]